MAQSRETVNHPIFPIYGVLFPGMQLQVRLPRDSAPCPFEDLVRRDRTLAVSLRRAPQETSKHIVEPHLVGTTARILDLQPKGASSLEILLAGVSRVHLLSYRHNGQHLVGQARYLPDLQESIPGLLVEEARALGSEFASSITKQGAAGSRALPKDAETLSYWIAQNLPIELDDRQELLELRTTSTRLSKEVSHMRVILDALRSKHRF